MNKFEEVVVGDIATIKNETRNCQKACLERHTHLDTRMDVMDKNQEDLKTRLFDPVDGIITQLNMANVRNGIVTGIAAFFGSAVGMLVLGYLFEKATNGHP